MSDTQSVALLIFALAVLWSITTVVLALIGKRREKDQ
jgi:hypothetical protein